MKTLPACLLCAWFAAATAAAGAPADSTAPAEPTDLGTKWSFSLGYGSARLNGGQYGSTASTEVLLPKDVAGSVSVFRLSVAYAVTEKFGIEASYLNFGELTTEHQLNPNGPQTIVAVDDRFRRKVQGLAAGPIFTFVPAEDWQITAGAGAVLSDLRTSLDGGGHGVQVFKTTGNPGWFGTFGASYALAREFSVGASLRYFDFNHKVFSSSSLTALQFDVFLALHF